MFSADVAGYSRLMAEDEAATVKTLKAYRKIMTELIKQHRGRVVDSPGDNVLAEFTSVVDGVQCAVAVQNELQARNAELPENRRMEFRIGINLGDVIEEEDRIYGDGVNIAARLEALADPGGICVSKTAFDQIETKLPLGYEYLGEQTVKNIAKPVGAYRVLMEPRVTVAEEIEKEKAVPLWRRKAVFAGAVAVLVVAVAAAIWNFYFRPTPPVVEPASVERMAFPLPEQPSIAVLPFENMSGDPEQDYFSDGLTEEIISGLSKVPSLFVIARNSSFIYKGKPVKVQQVSEALGVRYVLEGSVRKVGNRVRITAQLIDAISGHHLWSERYDRELEDIFDLQDEIMRDILVEMRVQLTEGVQARVWHKAFQEREWDLEAYEKVLQSRWHFFRLNPEGFAMARQLAEEAIEIDPNIPGAYVLLAFIHLTDVSKSPRKSMALAEKLAQEALQLDDSYPMTRITLGQIHLYKRRYEKAIAEGEKALALDPNGAEVHNHLGFFLHNAGRYEEAIPLFEKAIRLNPYPPSFYYQRLGSAYACVKRYDEAVDACKKALKRLPGDLGARFTLAAVYIWQGREEEARAEATEILRAIPQLSLRFVEAVSLDKNRDEVKRWIEAWRKAGLPE